jgi:hypothetical protein
VVQQYYHHSYYPTPPMLQCSMAQSLLCKNHARSMLQCSKLVSAYLHRHKRLCCTISGQPRPELHQGSAKPGYLSRFVNIRVFPSILGAILCVIVESELNKRSDKNEINTLHGIILHRYNVEWLRCFTVPLHRPHSRRLFTLSPNASNIDNSNCIPKQPYRLRKTTHHENHTIIWIY